MGTTITLCDFSLWGRIKDDVYVQQPRDVIHLKLLIEQEFRAFNNNIELCQTIYRSLTDRYQMCISTEGKRFEHFKLLSILSKNAMLSLLKVVLFSLWKSKIFFVSAT